MPILGHGIDIVELVRIESMLREHGDHFTERCFAAAEREYCDSSTKLRGERYAARFAAKEAVLKAFGTGLRQGLAFDEIEVVRDHDGAPSVSLSGKAMELAAARGFERWHLSLSHAGGFAIASAIVEGRG